MEGKQKWLRLDLDDGWQAVVPDTDIKPHGIPTGKKEAKGKEVELAGMDCPCKPKVDVGEKIIIHNSFEDMERITQSVDALGL